MYIDIRRRLALNAQELTDSPFPGSFFPRCGWLPGRAFPPHPCCKSQQTLGGITGTKCRVQHISLPTKRSPIGTGIRIRSTLKYSLDVYNLTNHPSFDIPIDNVSQNLAFNPFPSITSDANAVPSPSACAANGGNPFVTNYFYACPTGLGQVTRTIGSSRQIQMTLRFFL